MSSFTLVAALPFIFCSWFRSELLHRVELKHAFYQSYTISSQRWRETPWELINNELWDSAALHFSSDLASGPDPLQPDTSHQGCGAWIQLPWPLREGREAWACFMKGPRCYHWNASFLRGKPYKVLWYETLQAHISAFWLSCLWESHSRNHKQSSPGPPPKWMEDIAGNFFFKCDTFSDW